MHLFVLILNGRLIYMEYVNGLFFHNISFYVFAACFGFIFFSTGTFAQLCFVGREFAVLCVG